MNATLVFGLYNLLGILFFPVIALGVALRWRKRVFSKGLLRWSERWGKLPETTQALLKSPGKPWWWVHAVSVGEIKAIEPFLRRAPERAQVRIFLTVGTPEAITWAVDHQMAEAIAAAPIDLPWVVRRVARAVRPVRFITVESEFWPNLLREAGRAGARVALVNGRMSERSFRRYQKARFLLSALWACVDLWAVRQEEDAARFRDLGVPNQRLHVTGNLKYDIPLPVSSHEPPPALGCTREGEEVLLAESIQEVRKRQSDLRVIWAPRHVDRTEAITTQLRNLGITATRHSEDASWRSSPDQIWDTVGNLMEAYREAHVVVMGGSFVSKGGQNPLEPAALRRPVVFGPSMENFKGIADELVAEGGALQVQREELAGCLNALLTDAARRRSLGENARRMLERRQGATDRTLDLLIRS